MGALEVLKQMLIDGHPVTASDYTGTPEAVAIEINEENINTNADDINANSLMNTIDETEYNALVASERQTIEMVLRMPEIDPNGMGITLFKLAFGGGNTSTAVDALSQKIISHAVQEGIGVVKPGHVIEARL